MHNNTATIKRCYKCGEDKDRTKDYHKGTSMCKECRREKDRLRNLKKQEESLTIKLEDSESEELEQTQETIAKLTRKLEKLQPTITELTEKLEELALENKRLSQRVDELERKPKIVVELSFDNDTMVVKTKDVPSVRVEKLDKI